ncbi:MAG: RagB/SusD family nutrient uptake outer membrane protein [Bacteroidales bacterium]
MKTNKLKYILFSALSVIAFSSCNDWLTEPSPGTSQPEDFFTSGDAAEQVVTAAYVPLMWEFNSTFCPEWFIGDVASDDALKGGQSISDMADAYDIENFKVSSSNTLLLDYYRAQFQGVGRCNFAIEQIAQMETDDEDLTADYKDRLLGEAYFLRAMYYFRLARVFGAVPYVDFVVDSANDWIQPTSTQDEIYQYVKDDLELAQASLWLKSAYADEDMGRATKGAALAMLMKVNLYTHDYATALEWGNKFFEYPSEYSLCPVYADNFTLEGENGVESVFEIQYMEEATSDYGEGFGFTRGTFTTTLVRSRSSVFGSGWGFNKPTQDLYDAFEDGDLRRDVTILNPTDDEMETPEQEIYLGSRYVNRKFSMMYDDNTYYALSHVSRSPLNNTVIRYADVLLMYAEAAAESGSSVSVGQAKLNEVRARAEMSEYSGLDASTLKEAVRNERRVELAMEGHRWFDLCRWGIAAETMNEFKAKYSEAGAEMATFMEGKHEYMPLPSDELSLGELTQTYY